MIFMRRRFMNHYEELFILFHLKKNVGNFLLQKWTKIKNGVWTSHLSIYLSILIRLQMIIRVCLGWAQKSWSISRQKNHHVQIYCPNCDLWLACLDCIVKWWRLLCTNLLLHLVASLKPEITYFWSNKNRIYL